MSNLAVAVVFLIFEFQFVFSTNEGCATHALCVLPCFVGYTLLIGGRRKLWLLEGFKRRRFFIYLALIFEVTRFLGELFMYDSLGATMLFSIRLVSFMAVIYMTKIINNVMRDIEVDNAIDIGIQLLNKSWYWMLATNLLFFLVSNLHGLNILLMLIVLITRIIYCVRISHAKSMCFQNAPYNTIHKLF